MQNLQKVNFVEAIILLLIIFGVAFSFLNLSTNFFRIFYEFAIDWNEGISCYKVSGVVKGEELYGSINALPITPTAYPPLSFLIFGAFSYFFGTTLVTGRIIAFIALIFTLYMVYLVQNEIIKDKKISFLSSLLLLILIVVFTPHYVGMFDPQILGDAILLAALYFFIKSKSQYRKKDFFIAAILILTSLLIKYNLVVLPLAITSFLFLTNKKKFLTFITINIVLILIILFCLYIVSPQFFTNFFEADRGFSVSKAIEISKIIFYRRTIFLAMIVCIILISVFTKEYLLINLYLILGLIFGVIFSGGNGVDFNVWYDFFIALSIQVGRFLKMSTNLYERAAPKIKLTLILICVISVIPFLKVKSLLVNPFEQIKVFKENETLYLDNVKLLASFKNPTLFEEPLIGFLSGKKFIFDPFCGTQLMRSGKIPEEILLDKLKLKYFSVIVLRNSLNELVTEKDYQYWTNNVLQTMRENYFLLSKNKVNNRTDYFYYIPKQ